MRALDLTRLPDFENLHGPEHISKAKNQSLRHRRHSGLIIMGIERGRVYTRAREKLHAAKQR